MLPTNLVMDEYQVIGCFCSPECAAAYNHESFRQHEERLQYSLLNTLYKRFAKGEQIPIKLAPPKICLRIFGGNLSIEEFRKTVTTITRNLQLSIHQWFLLFHKSRKISLT